MEVRTHSRRIINLDEVLAAVSVVWSMPIILDFPSLTMEKTLRILAPASVLIGMFGSGLTNGIFIRKAGVVLLLLRDLMADEYEIWALHAPETFLNPPF